jgi:hypothetical protein
MFSLTLDAKNEGFFTDGVGVGDGSYTASYGGNDSTSYALFDNGNPCYNDNLVLNGAQPFPSFQHAGDIIDVAVDRVHNTMWVRVNGGAWNVKEFTITSTDDFVSHSSNGDFGGISAVSVDAADSYGPSVWRLFILDSDYPDIGNQVIIGSTVATHWGSNVTATVIDIIHDTGYGRWVFLVNQNITSGFSNGSTVDFAVGGGASWINSTAFAIVPSATNYPGSPVNTTYGSWVTFNDVVDSNLRATISDAFQGARMTSRGDGGYNGGTSYLWNVTWADNTTDVVRLTWESDNGDSGRLKLSVVDTTVSGWNTPRNNGTYPIYPTQAVKLGVYSFPARFSPILPVIVDGTNGSWC